MPFPQQLAHLVEDEPAIPGEQMCVTSLGAYSPHRRTHIESLAAESERADTPPSGLIVRFHSGSQLDGRTQ